MRDHILSNPEKMAGRLPNEKLQLDSNSSLSLSPMFKCEAVCSETKRRKEMRRFS